MLREALGLCLASLLLCASASFAQDDELLDPEELLGAEERQNPYSRNGWYVQFGYAYGIDQNLEDELTNNLDKASIPPPQPFITNPNTVNPAPPLIGAPPILISIGPAEVSNSSGIDARIGRRMLANLSVELQLEYMSNFETEIVDFGTIDVSTTAFTVNLRLPILTGRIQPYALIGGGAIWANPDSAWPQEGLQPSRVTGDPARFRDLINADNVGAVLRLGGGIDAYLTEHVYLASEVAWVTSQGVDVSDIKYLSVGLSVGYRF